jgi:hypothetical protein
MKEPEEKPMTNQYPLRFAFRSSRRTLRCLLLSIVVLFSAYCPSLVFGQSPTATLGGTVEDQNGAAIPGVTVTAINKGTQLTREATTNEQGSFTIPFLPPGDYSLKARAQGFAPVEFPNVVLNVGDQKALNIQLKAGDVNATVTVDSNAETIRTDGSVGTVVDRQFVANIPLNGRSFQSLITLTPGVVLTPNRLTNADGQFSVNGQRASANTFIVDGVNANFGTRPAGGVGVYTAGNLPGLTTFGTTQSLVSVDALQEFSVQTSSYSAEFGRQPGGQVSMVTRSGGNQFHGSLFDYLRNDVFDANDWFANRAGLPRPPERQNDFGGTFSGPVLLPRFGEGGRQPWYNGRNRTFFFFSYEGLRLRLPQFTLTNVPSLALRQQAPAGMQPILNAFPLPNGKDLGNGLAEFSASYSNPSALNATSIRIDHKLSNRLTLFGRYSQAPSHSNTRFVGNLSLIGSGSIKTKTLTTGLTASLTSRVVNDFRLNYSDNPSASSQTQDTLGGSLPIARSVLIPNQYDGSAAQANIALLFPGVTSVTPTFSIFDLFVTNQRQVNLIDSVSYNVGAHQFKFGVDYRRLSPSTAANSYLLNALFFSMQSVRDSSASFALFLTTLPAKPQYLNLSAFGQDTWRVSPRLTLNLGLRWEVNPPPDEANGNLPLAVTQISNLTTMQLAPRGTRLWKTTYSNFAPRIGVAYQLMQQPGRETVLRGGFGVFYDTGNDVGSVQFTRFPFFALRTVSNLTFPLNPAQVAPPPIPVLQVSIAPPYPTLSISDPALKLPYTWQWNLAVEQSLGRAQVLTVSYVGAAGRRLLQSKEFSLAGINPSFTFIDLTTNKATSSYDALQVQFQRRLTRGLQALASYTWSHSIDEDSKSDTNRLAQRGNADFDVRHAFAAAVTYDIPSPSWLNLLNAVLSRWSIDTSIHAQSALPLDLIATSFNSPLDGTLINVRPDVISGVPLYIADPSAPGGTRINRAAFLVPPAGRSGSLGRNILRGLPVWQVDFAVRRQFRLTEKLNLQLRAEAFNLFNHPNFGAIQTNLNAANFGQATGMLNRQLGGLSALYQIGGPRSFQFALKMQF